MIILMGLDIPSRKVIAKMGRRIKEGMEFFGHESNASNDPKIQAIESLYGKAGYANYFKLLEKIYQTAHAELEVKTELQIKVLAISLGEKIEDFKQYLSDCCEINLFDKKLFENDHVLTSNGIKKRRKLVDTDRERSRKWNEEHRDKPPETDDKKDVASAWAGRGRNPRPLPEHYTQPEDL
jgi:DNA-binding protein H-NS